MAEKDAVSTWSIDLEDNTSGTAETAVEALSKLKRQIESDTRALSEMQKALRNLQGGTVVNIAQFRELKAKIDAKKQSIAEAQSAVLGLGGAFTRTGRSARPTTSSLAELGKVASAMPGPIGGVVSRLGALKGMLAGGVIALGIAAIAAAFIALAAAAVAATAALLKYGIAQAGARRGELLRLEGLTKMRNWWGIAAGNAGEMQKAIDRVSDSTTLGRDKLEQYTGELYRMGVRGKNLALALEAAAVKGAILGDAGARSTMHWAAGLALTGKSVQRLRDDIVARFGPTVARMLLDWDVQTERLRRNFGILFRDLQIEELLKGLNSVTSLFSQSTRSGRALKAIVETIFQPLINAVTALQPVIKRFFQGMIIGALLIGIAVLKIRNWFRRTFGDSEILKGIDAQTAALKLGLVVVAGLAGMFAVLAVAMTLALAPFVLAGAAILGLVVLGKRAWSAFQAIEWGALGRSIIDGIVNGLKAGAKWVIDAVKGLGDSAMAALRSKLGISSPSKAFARLGLEIPRGIETGIGIGKPGTRSAVAGLVDVPRIPAAPDAPRAGDRGRAQAPTTIEVNLGGIQITTSASDAKELARDLEPELERLLEGVAIQLGALVPRGA